MQIKHFAPAFIDPEWVGYVALTVTASGRKLFLSSPKPFIGILSEFGEPSQFCMPINGDSTKKYLLPCA
jgi:hypothetical protein